MMAAAAMRATTILCSSMSGRRFDPVRAMARDECCVRQQGPETEDAPHAFSDRRVDACLRNDIGVRAGGNAGNPEGGGGKDRQPVLDVPPVSYTHLTLPT